MNAIVLYSGGIGSWVAAQRAGASYEKVELLFTDTRSEDEDTYRFLRDGARALRMPLIEIADGRTIWEVFRDVKFLANSRVDPCSRILKRDLARKWLDANRSPDDTEIIVGIDWTESHRLERMAARWLPWRVKAPMCDAPYLTKEQMHLEAEYCGIPRQRLYRMGAPHANCGGGCVKAGIGHFARLYRAWPERFAEWEKNEADLRDTLGDVSILRDRRGGAVAPLPLSVLRARLETDAEEIDLFEIGGCGCMVDTENEEAH